MRHLVHSLKLQVVPPVIIFWDIIVSLSAFKYSKCFVLCPPSDMHANKVNLYLKNFSILTFLFVTFCFFGWGSFQQKLVSCVPVRRILHLYLILLSDASKYLLTQCLLNAQPELLPKSEGCSNLRNALHEKLGGAVDVFFWSNSGRPH